MMGCTRATMKMQMAESKEHSDVMADVIVGDWGHPRLRRLLRRLQFPPIH